MKTKDDLEYVFKSFGLIRERQSADAQAGISKNRHAPASHLRVEHAHGINISA